MNVLVLADIAIAGETFAKGEVVSLDAEEAKSLKALGRVSDVPEDYMPPSPEGEDPLAGGEKKGGKK